VATKKKALSRMNAAILETARDLHGGGILRDEAFKKITMRLVDKDSLPDLSPLSGADIREMRERAGLSQAVFAKHLNLTTGYVSQLERGARRPNGAAAKLLDVIRRKGIDAIL
jgi:putative transcriptional regulator